MTAAANHTTEQCLSFGPFRLLRQRKQLLEGDKQVRLGGRAFDLLVALVERAGEVVSRQELEACVWPDTLVEETSLRAHVSALRKALGDGQGGSRFIANIPGRGYCFVAPVDRPHGATAAPAHRTSHNLPTRLTPVIGRGDVVAALAEMLPRRRFVTITGAGGMGKTTAALATAEELLGRFADGVRFIDLAPVADPELVARTVALAFEIALPADDTVGAACAALAEREALVVLDNCEHVIDAAAVFAESLLRAAPGVCVLATSREPLDAEGEWAYRLGALALPPESAGPLTAAEAIAFPAVALFVQRATSLSEAFALSDDDAPVLAALCRRLDGMPLAIEFAAARTDSLTLADLANGLDDRLSLLSRGRRTATPRHRTLRALLDWSHGLLTADEKTVFARLAAFKAAFPMSAACVVAADPALDASRVRECVMNLTAKSLLYADAGGEVLHYRLQESTHAYALERLEDSGESAEVRRRHARWVLEEVRESAVYWNEASTRHEWLGRFGGRVDDVRAALDWSFSDQGDPVMGIAITAHSMGPMQALWLLAEYSPRVTQAMAHVHRLPEPRPDLEMALHAARCFSSGIATRVRGAEEQPPIDKALALGDQTGDPGAQVTAHYGAWVSLFGRGLYREALAHAAQMGELARAMADPSCVLLSDRLTAQATHFLGDQRTARRLAERVLRHPSLRSSPAHGSTVPRRVSMRIILARVLWLEGCPDQAADTVREAIQLAADCHPIALIQVHAIASCPIALWRGDLAWARQCCDELDRLARAQSLEYWHSWAATLEALVRWRETALASGADSPRWLLRTANPKEWDCAATLAEGLATDETFARVQAGEAGWCAAEVLRSRAEELYRGGADPREAEAMLSQALQRARLDGALAWELRASVGLARLWHDQGRTAPARELVLRVLERFTEGHGTADLRAARALVDALDAETEEA